MKKSNIFKSIIALSCCLTMGLGALTGCGSEPECEHVYTVVDTVESTCTQAGRQTLTCGICGDVKIEDLPIDENAHVFTGEWAITLPTEEADGVAVKTCINNPEHKMSVTLPKVTITGSGYNAKEFIIVPTTAREGEMKLTLENTYGDITFSVPLAKRKLDNMEDAVVIASSLRENVRQADGWIQETKDGIQQNFSYYFGEDYTYINDEINNIESWYSLDDDNNVFAMSKKDGASTAYVETNPDKNFLYGFRYDSTINISSFYGAENGLAQIYEIAMEGMSTGSTINYQETPRSEFEEHKAKDGSINNLEFSYGYDAGSWFGRFKVIFSIYKDGTLKNLLVETEVIRAYMFATEPDGTKLYYQENDASVLKHGAAVGDVVFGYVYPTDFTNSGNAYEYDEKGNILYEQTNKNTGNVVYYDGVNYYDVVGGEEKTNDDGTITYLPTYQLLDYVPELEDVYIKDVYGEYLLDSKGNRIKKYMAMGGYPVTEHYSDAHSEVSYKTVYIEQTKKVTQEEIDQGLKEPEVVPENPYPYDSLYIKDFDITGATAAGSAVDLSDGLILPTNKLIKLSLGNITPSTANLNADSIANIYIKDATGALIKLKDIEFNNGSQYKVLGYFTQSDGTITINSQYAGTLTFIFETQSGKCKKEVEMTFTKSAPTSLTASADIYTVSDGVVSEKESIVNTTDRTVSLIVGQSLIFRANASGTEAAYVSTDILPTASGEGVTLSQNEEGSYREWKLVASETGEYTIKMPYYDGTSSSSTVYAEFKVIVSAKTEPMELLDGNTFSGNVYIARASGNPIQTRLTAEFTTETVDDGEIKIIKINVNGNDIVYTYGINDSGELVTEYRSGLEPSNKTYDFSFSIDEADNLIITHGTGYATNTESIVLTKEAEG